MARERAREKDEWKEKEREKAKREREGVSEWERRREEGLVDGWKGQK